MLLGFSGRGSSSCILSAFELNYKCLPVYLYVAHLVFYKCIYMFLKDFLGKFRNYASYQIILEPIFSSISDLQSLTVVK